jgi:anti-sigma regulatory factor (Ser/Thr protein kinase)
MAGPDPRSPATEPAGTSDAAGAVLGGADTGVDVGTGCDTAVAPDNTPHPVPVHDTPGPAGSPGTDRQPVGPPRPATTGDHLPPGALDQSFDAGALVALRSAVAAHGAEFGLSSQRLGDLVLIAHELASNAVNHGGDGGRLLLWRDDRYVHCRVIDDGHWQSDPAQLGHAFPPLGATSGRGLWLIRQLATYLDVQTGPGGTIATAGLLLDDGQPRTHT